MNIRVLIVITKKRKENFIYNLLAGCTFFSLMHALIFTFIKSYF